MRTTMGSLQSCYAFSNLPHRFIEKEHPSNIEIGTGAYLVGKPGTGKTWAAVTMAKRLIDGTYEFDDRIGVYRVASVKFTTSNGLMDAYKATYNDGTMQTEEEVTSRFAKCDLLVIDDLGKEKPTDWAISRLFEIVNARYERMRPIVVTTQYEKGKLTERLARNGDVDTATAIVSRLCETCRTVRFDGEDKRLAKAL